MTIDTVLVPGSKMTIREWLIKWGFTPFQTPNSIKWEDQPVSQGGVFIETCGDVAAVWCVRPKIKEACLSIEEVFSVVSRALLK